MSWTVYYWLVHASFSTFYNVKHALPYFVKQICKTEQFIFIPTRLIQLERGILTKEVEMRATTHCCVQYHPLAFHFHVSQALISMDCHTALRKASKPKTL